MKWTAEQKKALRESIAHWERMREYRLRDKCDFDRFKEMPWSQDCACCKKWLYYENPRAKADCEDCPIRQFSGLGNCEGTPYEQAYEIMESWLGGAADRRTWVRAATKEIDFLKKVLEAGK